MYGGWIECAAVAVVVLGIAAVHRHWRYTGWLAYLAHWVKVWAAANPATFVLWLLVALHAWMLAGLPASLRQSVLLVHSTNLSQLGKDPITVLAASAMWTDIGEVWSLTLVALLVLAPAERWLGTWRTVVVFLVGHVGATLVTAVWLNELIRDHVVNHSVTRAVDVGVSYGTFCVMALLCYRLDMRWRLPAMAALATYLLMAFYLGRTFTDFGHLTAMVLGFAMYPVTRRRSVRARRTTRWIGVPPDPRLPAPARPPAAEVVESG